MTWFTLAYRYIQFHKIKTAILIASIFLTAFLPITVKILLDQFNQKIVARASSTPLLIGAKGSGLDLTLHALYFTTKRPDPVPYGLVDEIRDTGWARPIPIYGQFTAQGYPIVGTSLDYFEFRRLAFASGAPLTQLGDCVIGAKVAEALELAPGDSLLSDPENVLDIAGHYPLKMYVRGVLQPTRTPDDWAVFVDLKTAWVIEGLGHGHQDLETETDDEKVMAAEDGTLQATAAVLPFMEITPDNIDSFHFHGELAEFPITAVIAVSPDVKRETMLIGRYRTADGNQQVVTPVEVIRELMGLVFQAKRFFDLNAILIAVSTALMLILVVVLSTRLRQREMETMFKLGCSRGTIALLQLSEMVIIFAAAGVLVAAGIWLAWNVSGDLVQSMLVGRNG